MDVGAFIHAGARDTLSEIKRLHGLVVPHEFMGLYAYATQSGVAAFELEMAD